MCCVTIGTLTPVIDYFAQAALPHRAIYSLGAYLIPLLLSMLIAGKGCERLVGCAVAFVSLAVAFIVVVLFDLNINGLSGVQ